LGTGITEKGFGLESVKKITGLFRLFGLSGISRLKRWDI
jgi:hypothetical protein